MFSLHKSLAEHRGRVFEQWVFDAHSPLLSGAAIADINKDGASEIIFGTKEGKVYCVDDKAQELWVYHAAKKVDAGEELFYDMENLFAISTTPVIHDLDNNGSKEIIFGSDSGEVFVLNPKGELLWKYTVGGAIHGIVVEDIDNDGINEVIVTSSNNKLMILSHDGKPIVDYKTPSSSQSIPNVLRGTNGKQSLIVFGLDDGTLHCVDTQEKQLWTFKTQGRITAKPIFVTVNKETLVIVGSWDGYVYAISMEGELRWKFKTGGAIYNQVSVGDVNNDGKKELIFGSCDNNIYTLTLTGDLLWSYQTDFWVMAQPLLVDIDNDGNTEVIAGSFDNNVYILEGAGRYEFDYVPGLSSVVHQTGHYADVLSNDPGSRQGKRLWQYKTKGMIVGCAIIEGNTPQLIVNVKSGFVDALEHQK